MQAKVLQRSGSMVASRPKIDWHGAKRRADSEAEYHGMLRNA